MEKNLFWVLSRVTLEIYKPIMWQDNIEVETWPKTIDRLLYIRDFIVRNEKKEVIAKATSAWLAIDRNSKRPKMVDTEYAKMLSELNGKHALKTLPEKLNPICNGETSVITPTFFNYDLNKHVTATNYIDWMMDSLAFDFHENHYPTALVINYLKETLQDESVELLKNQEHEDVFSFNGTNLNSGVPAFRGRITF